MSVPPLRAPSDPSCLLEWAHKRLHLETHLPPTTKSSLGADGMSVGQEGWAPQALSWWAPGRDSMELQAPSRTMPFQLACPCASETLQPIHNWEGDAVQPHGQQIQLGFSLPERGTRSNLSFLKNVITECNGNASKRLQEQDPCLKS